MLDRFQKIIERYCGRALKRVAETVNTSADRYIEGIRYHRAQLSLSRGKICDTIFLDILPLETTIETVDHFSSFSQDTREYDGVCFQVSRKRKGVRPFNILACRPIVHTREEERMCYDV